MDAANSRVCLIAGDLLSGKADDECAASLLALKHTV